MLWDIAQKTVLITGGTDGIGKAAMLALLRRGAEVVLFARDMEKAQAIRSGLGAKGRRMHIIECDLASFASIREAAGEYERRFSALHVLLNSAGVMPTEQMYSKDGIELNRAVNYLAPVLLTELLLPLMLRCAPARIINVTSSLYKVGSIDLEDVRGERKPFNRYQAYGDAKMALMLYTRELAGRLRDKNVAVNAVHPGWIRTKLATATLQKSGFFARIIFPLLRMRPAWWGARTLVYLASDPAIAVTGEYFISKKIASSNEMSQDLTLARALVEKTRALLAPYL